jgi:hypothetical protein
MTWVARIPDLDDLLSLLWPRMFVPATYLGASPMFEYKAKVSDNSYIFMNLYMSIYNSTLKLDNDTRKIF